VFSTLKKGDASFLKTQIVFGNKTPVPLHPSGLIVFDLFSEKQIPSSSGRFATRGAAHFSWGNPKRSVVPKPHGNGRKNSWSSKTKKGKHPKEKRIKGFRSIWPGCFPDTLGSTRTGRTRPVSLKGKQAGRIGVARKSEYDNFPMQSKLRPFISLICHETFSITIPSSYSDNLE